MASGVKKTDNSYDSYTLKETDLSRWRLTSDNGTQRWKYLTKEEAESWPQTAYDKYHLGLPTVRELPFPFVSAALM